MLEIDGKKPGYGYTDIGGGYPNQLILGIALFQHLQKFVQCIP